jgi:membrane fusion protein
VTGYARCRVIESDPRRTEENRENNEMTGVASDRIVAPSRESVTRQQLFRPESLEARRSDWIGRNTLSLGFPVALSSFTSLLLMVGTAALLLFGTYARRVDLRGLVLPEGGLVQVTAQAGGRIDAIPVHNDEVVTANQLLYIVNLDTTTPWGDTQARILQDLSKQHDLLAHEIKSKEQLRQQEDAGLQDKIHNLQAQILQMQKQMTLTQVFLQTDTKTYGDFEHFQRQGLGTVEAKLAKQQIWMHAMEDLEQLKSTLLKLRSELISTQSQKESLDLQTDIEVDDLGSKLAELDKAVASSEARRSIEVRAPIGGTVTAINAHLGQIVTSGTRLLTLVPADQKMQVALLAPSTAIGFIHSGERVQLHYSAYPYQKFGQYGGTITEVSRVSLDANEIQQLIPALSPAEQSKTYYRIVVMPDRQEAMVYGRPKPLQASMQVDARILLDRHKLYEWILDSFYSFHGSQPARQTEGLRWPDWWSWVWWSRS